MSLYLIGQHLEQSVVMIKTINKEMQVWRTYLTVAAHHLRNVGVRA